ncbi:sugar phosphate isomerase/epimerase family protein [Staphylococcus kloosii]|jgi:inosose dehydratase|uniref:sugar phosphate isomerase/epimerase family protein n=1 Tax=Staphylococcus kloosii TaxID=29384 RepID=UPI0018A126ED|nr:sugar phosphate isomerase/epimerase [Staphylococcus kloosii]MBF7025538.1 TIM barrel protein [Staphylococcus kloosii]
MNIKLGTAPDSWGVWFSENEKQVNWKQCLNEMEKAGYEGLELGPWGYLPNDKEKLSKELQDRNLELVATTVVGDLTSEEATQKLIDQIKKMAPLQLHFEGAKYIVLIDDCYTDLFTGEVINNINLNNKQWNSFVKNIDCISNFVKENYDLEVVFHPHAQSHIETEEQIINLLNDSDINLCLDTGHHAYTGGNSVEFMKKYHDRIPYLHLKSCDMEVKKKMEENDWSFATAVAEGIMCEPELGIVDMDAFFKVLNDIDYNGWIVVEQDMYPIESDKPYPIAKRTREYLEKQINAQKR